MKQLLTLILLLFSIHLSAQTKGDAIIGIWLTSGKEPARIQVYKQGNTYYGKIVWLKNPTTNGVAKVDSKNPDKSKRSREIIGLVILNNFSFDDEEWSGGKIYDPESGNTYSCNLSLKDNNTLKVRGYIGISLLGRTETWTRSAL